MPCLERLKVDPADSLWDTAVLTYKKQTGGCTHWVPPYRGTEYFSSYSSVLVGCVTKKMIPGTSKYFSSLFAADARGRQLKK